MTSEEIQEKENEAFAKLNDEEKKVAVSRLNFINVPFEYVERRNAYRNERISEGKILEDKSLGWIKYSTKQKTLQDGMKNFLKTELNNYEEILFDSLPSAPDFFKKIIEGISRGIKVFFIVGDSNAKVWPCINVKTWLRGALHGEFDKGFGIKSPLRSDQYIKFLNVDKDDRKVSYEKFLETRISDTANENLMMQKVTFIYDCDILFDKKDSGFRSEANIEREKNLSDLFNHPGFEFSDNLVFVFAEELSEIPESLRKYPLSMCISLSTPNKENVGAALDFYRHKYIYRYWLDRLAESRSFIKWSKEWLAWEKVAFEQRKILNQLVDRNNKAEMVELFKGLSIEAIEKVYIECLKKMSFDLKEISAIKKTDLEKVSGGRLIPLNAGVTFDKYIGMPEVKKYVKECIIEPIKKGEEGHLPHLLFVGPPGTGKTFFVESLCKETGLLGIEFKVSNCLGKYVGDSESNFEQALQTINTFGRCFVFVDEIDQVFSRGGRDEHHVVKNIFSRFLTFLSSPHESIWIAATNYASGIDSALIRAGRFDKIIPFFPGDIYERVATLQLYLSMTNIPIRMDENDFLNIGRKIRGYTQAEISGVVTKVKEMAKRRESEQITYDLLDEAISYIRNMKNDQIEKMTQDALENLNDLELVNKEIREKIINNEPVLIPLT